MVVKRVVVGAHYGLASWLAQRVTAVVMALYSVILLVVFARRMIRRRGRRPADLAGR